MKFYISYIQNKTVILIIILCGLISSGCIFRSLAFQNIDWLVIYRADNMFNLTDEQEDFLEPRIDEWIKWLRISKFDFLNSALIELKIRSIDVVTVKDRDSFYDKIGRIFTDLILFAADDVSKFLASLNDDQLKFFSNYLKEQNEKYIEIIQYSKPDYRKKKEDRFKTRLNMLEEYFGYLTEKQKSVLQSKITFNQENDKYNFAHRMETQKVWFSLLKTHDQMKIKKYILQWANNPTAGRSGKYKRYYSERKKKRSQEILFIYPLLEPEQKKHFADFIDKLINDLQML